MVNPACPQRAAPACWKPADAPPCAPCSLTPLLQSKGGGQLKSRLRRSAKNTVLKNFYGQAQLVNGSTNNLGLYLDQSKIPSA